MLKQLSKALSVFGPFVGLAFVYALFLVVTWAISDQDSDVFDSFRSCLLYTSDAADE